MADFIGSAVSEFKVCMCTWIKRRRRVSAACSVDSRYALNPPYKKYCAASGGEFNPERFKEGFNMMNLMWKNKKLVWTNELSVGNAVIDAEHKNLISMVNDVVDAIRARDHDDLEQAFDMLDDWVSVHFFNEEKIAQAIGFDFSKHRLAQQYCLDELRFLRDELVGGKSLWCKDTAEHFARFLSKWIIDDHIIGLDMQMKSALQKYDYSFCPNLEGDKGKSVRAPFIRNVPRFVVNQVSA